MKKQLAVLLLAGLSQSAMASGFSINTVKHDGDSVVRFGVSDKGFRVSVVKTDRAPHRIEVAKVYRHHDDHLSAFQKAKILKIKSKTRKQIAQIDHQISHLNKHNWNKKWHRKVRFLEVKKERLLQKQRQEIRTLMSENQWRHHRHSI